MAGVILGAVIRQLAWLNVLLVGGTGLLVLVLGLAFVPPAD